MADFLMAEPKYHVALLHVAGRDTVWRGDKACLCPLDKNACHLDCLGFYPKLHYVSGGACRLIGMVCKVHNIELDFS